MKKSPAFYLSLAVLSILVGAFFGFMLANHKPTPATGETSSGSGTVKARVVEVLEQGTVELGNHTQLYQILEVEILEGAQAGQMFSIDYGKHQVVPSETVFHPGEQLLVTIGQLPDGTYQAHFADFLRTKPIIWLAIFFALFTIVVSRGKGLRSLLSMAISFGVILFFILPAILHGDNPILVSILGSLMLLAATQYLIYGWTLKAHTSLIGMLLALVLTSLLASISVNICHLTGFGSEEAILLSQIQGAELNIRGLLLSGIIIGALGVLDDLAVGQVSIVFELHHANPQLSWTNLFRRAMIVGQDHIAATVNTLVLAYVGASLPLLLLFTLYNEPFLTVLNREFIVEEVIRTLVGSMGLICAVPICTALACSVTQKADKLTGFARWLGPRSLERHQ